MKFVAILGVLASLATASPILDDRASRYSFYNMPTPEAGPCDLANGPDGALWGEAILSNKIFRLDPKTNAVEEFNIPYTNDPYPYSSLPGNSTTRGAFACAIRPGADGYMYAASGVRNQLVRINVTTKEITVFTPPPPNPLGNLQPFNDLYTDAEGMWFTQTTADVVTYYRYADASFTNYPVSGSPLGMFVAGDGLAYYAELLGNRLGRIDRRTGRIEHFPLPPQLAGPAVIRVETEGRYVWFTATIGNAVGRFDRLTGAVKAYPNNLPLSLPGENTLSPDGRVWFSSMSQNALNYVEPKSGKVTNIEDPETVVLAPISIPFQLDVAVNYFKGAIWFTQVLGNRIGRYQL